MNILNSILKTFTTKKSLFLNNIDDKYMDIDYKYIDIENNLSINTDNNNDNDKILIDIDIKLRLINDNIENIKNTLYKNIYKRYIIFLPEHNIKLEGEVYNYFTSGVDFKINKNNGNIVNFIIGYKYNYFDSIEFFSWDKYEKCEIYEIII